MARQRHPVPRGALITCCLFPLLVLVVGAGVIGGRALYAHLTAAPSCGRVLDSLNSGVVSMTPATAETCFFQAFARCNRKGLTLTDMGVDSGERHDLVVEPRDQGCVINDARTGYGCCFNFFPKTDDHTCTGLEKVQSGFRLSGCKPDFPNYAPVLPVASPSPHAALSPGNHPMQSRVEDS